MLIPPSPEAVVTHIKYFPPCFKAKLESINRLPAVLNFSSGLLNELEVIHQSLDVDLAFWKTAGEQVAVEFVVKNVAVGTPCTTGRETSFGFATRVIWAVAVMLPFAFEAVTMHL